MKNFFTLIVSLVLFQALQAQTIQGKWMISTLITGSGTEEYILSAASDKWNYGNTISINPDGTFVSAYSAFCGNDCFTTTTGKYELINGTHIRFFLEKISRHGECAGNSEPNKDLGLYYVHNEKGMVRLIKSVGNIQQDKMKLHFMSLCDSSYAEIKKYENVLSSDILPDNMDRNSMNDIIAFCMSKNKIGNYEILYSRLNPENHGINIGLVKIDTQYCFVYYPVGSQQVCLYNDGFIQKIDKAVVEINQDRQLKYTGIDKPANGNAHTKNSVQLYLEGKQIHKAVYKEDYGTASGGGSLTTTVYFQHDEPIYFEVERFTVYTQSKFISKMGFYVKDWQSNKIVVKQMEKHDGIIGINFSDRSIEKFRHLVEVSKNVAE